MKENTDVSDIEIARKKWLEAQSEAAKLSGQLFQPGDGHGDPNAIYQDQHKLNTAIIESQRLYQEFKDLEKRDMDNQILELQKSQKRAGWISVAVAIVVGASTIANSIIAILGYLNSLKG